MVRFYAKSCGKAEIRHTLQSHFEKAFISGKKRTESEDIPKPKLIVIDLLQYIKHIKPGVSEYSQSMNPGYVGCDDIIGMTEEGVEYTSKFSAEEEVKLRNYSQVVNYLTSIVEKTMKSSLGNIRINPLVNSQYEPLVNMEEQNEWPYDSSNINPPSPSEESTSSERVVVVICLDKYKYTCPARRIVHHDRAKEKRENELSANEFFEPSLVDPLLYPLDQVTEDKKGNSSVLFRFLIRHMIDIFRGRKYNRDFMFVFDGHCFDGTTAIMSDFWRTKDDTLEDGDEKFRITDHNDNIIRDLYDTPIMLHKTVNKECKLLWLKAFENQLGESDFSPFFYYNHFHLFNQFDGKDEINDNDNDNNNNNNGRKNSLTMDILSFDTDTLIYSLIFLELKRCGSIKNDKEPEDEDSRLVDYINIQYTRVSSKTEPKWIQVRKLMKYIGRETGKGKKKLNCPALQLAIGSIIGGSDYTEKHKMVPHKHFVNAYLSFYKLIGDIVRVEDGNDGNENRFYKLALKADNYISLIIMSYIQSKIKTKLWNEYVDKLKDAPTYEEVEKILVSHFVHDDKSWLPTHTDILYSACQIQYYLNMISRLGESSADIELHDSNLEDYSYARYSESLMSGEKEDTDLDVTIGVLPNRMVRLIHSRTPQEIEKMVIKITGNKPTPKKPKKPKKTKEDINEVKKLFDKHNDEKKVVKKRKTKNATVIISDDSGDEGFGKVVVGKKRK